MVYVQYFHMKLADSFFCFVFLALNPCYVLDDWCTRIRKYSISCFSKLQGSGFTWLKYIFYILNLHLNLVKMIPKTCAYIDIC